MKRLLLLSILMCASFGLVGQTVVDRFTCYDEMAGQNVWFYNMNLMREVCGDYIYQMGSDGKFKKVSSDSLYESLSTEEVQISGVYKDKGKNYLQVYISGTRYHLLISKKSDFMMNARSASYWKQLMQEASRYKYISTSSYIVKGQASRLDSEDYVSLRWAALKRPQSLDDEVYFNFTTSYNSLVFRFRAQDFAFYKKDFVIVRPVVSKPSVSVSSDKGNAGKEYVMDSNRVFDAELQLAYSVKNFLDSKGEEYISDEPLPFAVYSYSGGEYYGYLLGYECHFDEDLVSLSDHDAQYLKNRGTSGMSVRKIPAKTYDEVNASQYRKKVSEHQENMRKEEEQAKAKSREVLQYLRKNRVIIGNYYVSESYSDYSLKLEIYNWFTKRIKYIDLTVMAINSVGDPRWYDKDRCVKNIQCIGYIDALGSGTYKFDDLFYDSSEVIDDIIVCGAVITFEDNSKITIDSQAAARKLYFHNHDIEIPDNFYYYIR